MNETDNKRIRDFLLGKRADWKKNLIKRAHYMEEKSTYGKSYGWSMGKPD